jgi:hypothetical protein
MPPASARRGTSARPGARVNGSRGDLAPGALRDPLDLDELRCAACSAYRVAVASTAVADDPPAPTARAA